MFDGTLGRFFAHRTRRLCSYARLFPPLLLSYVCFTHYRNRIQSICLLPSTHFSPTHVIARLTQCTLPFQYHERRRAPMYIAGLL